MTFLAASLEWFLGKKSSHMGPDQYVGHAGMRDGRSTSGALLWAESEMQTVSASGNMVNAETNLLRKVALEIVDYIPTKTSVIELGPGTVTAFKNKTLPIIQSLNTPNCVLVDESAAFLKQIVCSEGLGDFLEIKPVIDDFFETENPYTDEESLVCSFGSTISNFLGPISSTPPKEILMNGLSKMALAAKGGWMLIGFDSNHDGENLKAFYKGEQELFQLNIFDRMAVELPIEGDFDPIAFEYEPEWISSSGQLAHIAVVKRGMNFQLNGTNISLKAGQKLHIKNSYKFTAEFFEECCRSAHLSVIKSWANDSPAKIYLLKILPHKHQVNLQNTVRNASPHTLEVA